MWLILRVWSTCGHGEFTGTVYVGGHGLIESMVYLTYLAYLEEVAYLRVWLTLRARLSFEGMTY